MATFWVDSEGSGSDANDGSSLLLAKRTLGAALGLITSTVGNTLNVVARATAYPVTATTIVTDCTGTSHTAFGCLIRGTDTLGNPSIARVAWEDSATAHTAIRFQGTSSFCTVRGFDLDRRGNSVASSVKRFVEINSTSVNNIRIQACIDHPQDSPVIVSGHILNVLTNNTNNIGEVGYCYFLDPRTNTGVAIVSGASCTFEYHHNIHEHNITQPGFHITNAGFGSTTNISIHHNTIVIRNTGRALFFSGNHTVANAASRLSCHSNVVAEVALTTSNTSFMVGNVAWEDATWTGTKEIGWNVFTSIGTSFNWTAVHPYAVPWDSDNSDAPDDTGQVWAFDAVANSEDPFNSSTAAWTWNNVGGLGYNLPLSGDLRLKMHRRVGKNGTVPGAIAENELIGAGDLQFYLSGGANNTDPNSSLGGVISATDVVAEAIFRNLFDDVASGELTAGTVEYRCFYIRNTSPTSTLYSSEMWLSDSASGTTKIDIGPDSAGTGNGVVSGVATTIANELTAPSGVTFSAPTGTPHGVPFTGPRGMRYGNPNLVLGTLEPGQCLAIWVKRTVFATTVASPLDNCTITLSGSDL